MNRIRVSRSLLVVYIPIYQNFPLHKKKFFYINILLKVYAVELMHQVCGTHVVYQPVCYQQRRMYKSLVGMRRPFDVHITLIAYNV